MLTEAQEFAIYEAERGYADGEAGKPKNGYQSHYYREAHDKGFSQYLIGLQVAAGHRSPDDTGPLRL